jgi:hypothetical protein
MVVPCRDFFVAERPGSLLCGGEDGPASSIYYVSDIKK